MKTLITTFTFTVALLVAVAPPAQAIVYPGDPDSLWPDGVVPFEWAPEISFSNRLRVIEAMQIWKNVAEVDFVPRTDEDDYVLIRDALPNGNDDPGGSSSPTIGRGGGQQILNIRIDLSGITAHGLGHELGHVLGLYHTMQRSDRDEFLEYFPDRTATSGQGNFSIKESSLAWPRDAMDYDSLMSYGRCTFANCAADTGTRCLENTPEELESCRNLRIIHPAAAAEFERKMGQRNRITRIDELGMSFLYPKPDWRFVEKDNPDPGDGTFHHPYFSFLIGHVFVPVGGTLWIHPGGYTAPASGRLDKSMALRAPLGGVRITLEE